MQLSHDQKDSKQPPSAQRPYDLLLLDFGGVCLLNPVELHRVAEAKLGLPEGTFTWLGPVDPSTDPLWQELLLSGPPLREREYWTRRATEVGQAAGLDMSLTEFMQLTYDPPSDDLVRPSCTEVVARAQAADLSVSILTNDLTAFHGPEWQNGISLLSRIDHLVDCSVTNILKPDPRAFERAMEITGFPADRILFVDDLQISVDGAEAVGIDALWFNIADPVGSWDRVAERIGV